jgi:hypothetical protein
MKYQMTLKSVLEQDHGNVLHEVLDKAEQITPHLEEFGYVFEYHLIRERDQWFTLDWSGRRIEAWYKTI